MNAIIISVVEFVRVIARALLLKVNDLSLRVSVAIGIRRRPDLYFVFEGIQCVVDPSAMVKLGLYDGSGCFTSGIIRMAGRKDLILVSYMPDFQNPEHLAVLWHEVGHARKNHLALYRRNYVATGQAVVFVDAEIEADAYAAERVGSTAMMNALEAIIIGFPEGLPRSIVEHRIYTLEDRMEEVD